MAALGPQAGKNRREAEVHGERQTTDGLTAKEGANHRRTGPRDTAKQHSH